MKYFSFLIFLFFISFLIYAREVRPKEKIRRLFYSSIESKDTLNIFGEQLKELQSKVDENFFLAYHGAYLTLVAKHSLNPYTKYFKLKDGIKLLNKTIQKQPESLEFRFLRLSILNYLPPFLGYDDWFFEDYEKIIVLIKKKDFSEVDKQTQKGILEFLLRSSKLNFEHKKTINKIYQDFK